jgi:hypothetical protein
MDGIPQNRRLTMAASAVNKSQAIRDYYSAHPRAKPKDVVAGLAEKNIDVSTQIVSTVRYNMKKKRRGARRGRRAAAKVSNRSSVDNGQRHGPELITTLIDAKKLSERLGGIDRAKQALKMLERLM